MGTKFNLEIQVSDTDDVLVNGVQVPIETADSGEVVPEPVATTKISFQDLMGFTFGQHVNGREATLPGLKSGQGVTGKFYVGDKLALEYGISNQGGNFHVCPVGFERNRWSGNQPVQDNIDKMGLENSQYGVFPKDGIKSAPLTGVEYDGSGTRMEFWQNGKPVVIVSMNGAIPPEQASFTLAASGASIRLKHSFG